MKNHIEYFNLEEKIAALKILILLVSADYKIDEKDEKLLAVFVKDAGLKLTESFFNKTLSENIDDMLSVFTNKENYTSLEKLCIDFSKNIAIEPDSQGKLLTEIYSKIDENRKQIKTGFDETLKNVFREFGFLWGQNTINPKNKLTLALIFTIAACILGSFWTYQKFFGIGPKKTIFVLPQFSAVLSGILIYSALAIRKYLPPPSSFRNILFFVFNVYLLSLIAMYIIGRSGLEKTLTITIFFGLIVLLWLGMKELLGFFFLGVFVLFVFKIVMIDVHMDWRAFPFIILAFMGISFQSNNFFNDFISFASSFNKTPEIDKKIVVENINIISEDHKNTDLSVLKNIPKIEIPKGIKKKG